MTANDLGDDQAFEQASGDAGSAALRQLQRRYDVLRHDYEALIDRLGELEDRLAAREPGTRGGAPGSVAEAILSPLLRLRDEYLQAATAIQQIAAGLETLATGTMKGQHGAGGGQPARRERAAPPPSPPTRSEAASSPPPPPPGPAAAKAPERLQVDVKGSGFGDLLDFQENLSRLPGVARVSINAIDNDRASLIVELVEREPQ